MIQDTISTGVVDQVLQEFLNALQNDFSRIESIAKGLFYYLAGIQIVISSIWLIFKGSAMEALVKALQIVFTISVFYTLVLFGGHWMPQIINGFVSAGANSSGISSLTPSSVINQGLSIGFTIMDNFSHWGWLTHPLGSLLAVVLLVVIIILYALIAAELAIVLIKSYMLITLSGLMFAFGANEAVRPIAMNYFKAVIGIGFHLLALYLIMGVGVQVGQDWSSLVAIAAQQHALKPFLIVFAAVIVFYLIVKNVPSFIAGLTGIGGFRSYGDAAIGAAVTAGGVGARTMMTIGTAGIGGVGSTAQMLGQGVKGGAQTTMSAFQGMQAGMGIKGAVGETSKQFASSMGGSIKDTVMKANQHMSFGQKFNAKMAEKMAQQAATTSSSGGQSATNYQQSSAPPSSSKPQGAPDSSFKSNNVKK